MNWKNVLKNSYGVDYNENDWVMPIADLIRAVRKELKDFLDSQLSIKEGDWDDEFEGYRDASEFSLYIDYPNGELELSPSDTHEDDDDVTVSFEIDYVGKNALRIGSYTGMDGYYIASQHWGEDYREDLQELYDYLETRKGM